MNTYRILSTTLGVVLAERFAETPMEALGDFGRSHGFTGYHDMLVSIDIDPDTIQVRPFGDDDDLMPCSCCGSKFLIDHHLARFDSADGVHFAAYCPLCAEGSPLSRDCDSRSA